MPDLARFTDFARGVGAVAPACSTCSTVAPTMVLQEKINENKAVAPVAPVAPRNSDEGHDFSAHVEAFDLHCNFEERAAIREYSGGFPRHEAEALAWDEVYGDRAEAA